MSVFTTVSKKPSADREPVSYVKEKQLISKQAPSTPQVPTPQAQTSQNREAEIPLYQSETLQDIYAIPNDTKVLGIEKRTWMIGAGVAVIVLIAVGFIAYKKAK